MRNDMCIGSIEPMDGKRLRRGGRWGISSSFSYSSSLRLPRCSVDLAEGKPEIKMTYPT